MGRHSITTRLAFLGAILLLAACADETTPPTGPDASLAASPIAAQHSAADLVQQAPEPFTVRAPLDPFKIHANPDFMIHSRARSDLVIQRNTFAPGAGPWHTHPGPSFIIVAAGQIKLERFSPKHGCTETQVYSVGDAYVEVADEVHRAVVVSSEAAVLHVTRFIPVGAAITTPAPDPGC
jgi:quercetin dioxygenase-like cupin family protein